MRSVSAMTLDTLALVAIGILSLVSAVATLRVVARDGHRRVPTDPRRLP